MCAGWRGDSDVAFAGLLHSHDGGLPWCWLRRAAWLRRRGNRRRECCAAWRHKPYAQHRAAKCCALIGVAPDSTRRAQCAVAARCVMLAAHHGVMFAAPAIGGIAYAESRNDISKSAALACIAAVSAKKRAMAARRAARPLSLALPACQRASPLP